MAIEKGIQNLKSKTEELVYEYRKLKLQRQKLLEENMLLRKNLETNKKTLETLENKQKVTGIAKVIRGEKKNTTELKAKIDEVIKEVDKCIDLIKN
jgi:septin family protein